MGFSKKRGKGGGAKMLGSLAAISPEQALIAAMNTPMSGKGGKRRKSTSKRKK